MCPHFWHDCRRDKGGHSMTDTSAPRKELTVRGLILAR